MTSTKVHTRAAALASTSAAPASAAPAQTGQLWRSGELSQKVGGAGYSGTSPTFTPSLTLQLELGRRGPGADRSKWGKGGGREMNS